MSLEKGFIESVQFNRVKREKIKVFFLKGMWKELAEELSEDIIFFTDDGELLKGGKQIAKYLNLKSEEGVTRINFYLKNIYWHKLDGQFPKEMWNNELVDAVVCEIHEWRLYRSETFDLSISIGFGWHSNWCPIWKYPIRKGELELLEE
jgi:hypothetical protein